MDRAEVFSAPAVSMQQMLLRREERAQQQRAMLEETRCAALVSFTLNIPGPVKQPPALQRAFEAGKEQLSLLFAGHILKTRTTRAVTGSELLLALDLVPETVKSRLVQLENRHPIGRLFDMDVLDREGALLSRTALSAPRRRCLVCGQDAKLCARSAAHLPEALQSRIASLLDGYFRDRAADQFASCACRALLYEVSVTPKPGLVDRHNAGSHTDMDFFSFLDSAAGAPIDTLDDLDRQYIAENLSPGGCADLLALSLLLHFLDLPDDTKKEA